MKRGKFITLEGSEGAGKSTAMAFIKEMLTDLKHDVVMTREPGGTAIADEIRKVLLFPDTAEQINPTTELLLMFASRAQHIENCIEPALRAGKWVVSDRYVDASYAYQGGGRGLPEMMVEQLDKMVVGRLYPDLTLLFDVPADVGALRTERRPAEKDRIEQEKLEFFERVRTAYLTRAKQDPARIKMINGNQSLVAVQSQIREVLTPIVASWAT